MKLKLRTTVILTDEIDFDKLTIEERKMFRKDPEAGFTEIQANQKALLEVIGADVEIVDFTITEDK